MARVKCPRCFTVNPDGQGSCVKCGAALPKINIEAPPPKPVGAQQDASKLRPGQALAGRYTILSMIGRGGMGCIYKVHDTVLQEEVALKTLLPQYVKDKLVVTRFFNEARIARKMAHPNIVRVHDIGTAGSIVYISMEYLHGKSLRTILEGLPTGQCLPLDQALHVVEELCKALEYAHRYTVHRDIKPENVMIGGQGAVKLMDFGISKLMADTRLTGASVVMGTPYYMSPEQLRNSRDVDARADIYSLGVVLYEMLTGNMPTGVPRPASEMREDLPPALDAVVQRCVEPDPDNRYQSVTELRQALAPIRRSLGLPDGAAPTPILAAAKPPLPWRKMAGALLALAFAAGTLGALWFAEQRRAALVAEPPRAERPAAKPAPAPATPFDQLARAVQLAKLAGRSRAANNPDAAGLVQQGNAHWETAQEQAGHDAGQAQALGKLALQYYMGAALYRSEMEFVPPGEVELAGKQVRVPAFLIDKTEVTIKDYANFCISIPEGWPFPAPLQPWKEDYPNHPITYVSFYDAQAYAAFNGKQLPTELQWARAAYGGEEAPDLYPWGDVWEPGAANTQGERESTMEVRSFENDVTWSDCADMAGNVSEWTRSPEEDGAPGFGTHMVVRGGNFAQAMELREHFVLPYAARKGYVGFRCVLDLPTEPGSARALLR